MSLSSRWPTWRPIRSRRIVTGLSAITCDLTRKPFLWLGSMVTRKSSASLQWDVIGHQIPKPLQSTRERPTHAIDLGLPPPSRFVYGPPSSAHRVRSTAIRVGHAHDAANAWPSFDQPLTPCVSPSVTRYSVTRYGMQSKPWPVVAEGEVRNVGVGFARRYTAHKSRGFQARRGLY